MPCSRWRILAISFPLHRRHDITLVKNIHQSNDNIATITLPGCMADGETPEEAIADARGAFACWIEAHIEDGRPMPEPGGTDAAPVRFVQRLPRSLHAALKALAASDGVSLNTMAAVLIAEGVGKRNVPKQHGMMSAPMQFPINQSRCGLPRNPHIDAKYTPKAYITICLHSLSCHSTVRDRYLDDDEFRAVQRFLVEHPEAGDVIPHSGGCRLRWAMAGRGKRGAYE
jgi:antitoxin HicB